MPPVDPTQQDDAYLQTPMAPRPAPMPEAVSNPDQRIVNVNSVRSTDNPNRMGGTKPAAAPKRKTPAKKAKTPAMIKLHARLMQWWNTEREIQSWNRYQMAIDEDFFDGLQWSDEDAAVLMARGQAPLVYNHIKPTVNWMLGTERRTRTDGVVLPREADDEKGAEVKSKLLKYLSDVNRLPFARSAAFEDCIIAGVGWLEDRISTDPNDELLQSGAESWRNVWYDSTSTEKDINKDARYVFRRRIVDLDYAIALCPEYEAELRSASIDSDQLAQEMTDEFYLGHRVNSEEAGDYGTPTRRAVNPFSASASVESRRSRVQLIECWYKTPENTKVLRGQVFEGEDFTGSEEQLKAIDEGLCFAVPHVRMQMRVALMTDSFILYEAKSPYKHNRFPLTPMWCYRRKRDNAPYGIIRDVRDAQEDYNKRASKALYVLSTNQLEIEEGAVDDIEDLRAEAARPDGVLVIKKNVQRFARHQDKQLAEEHLMLMDRNRQAIRDVGGVTDQNLGQDDKGLSGKAIGKLQDQGSIVNTPIFDNRLLALQIQSENQLSLIEQFYTMPKVVRIVGEKQPIDWLKLNQYDQEQGQWINDITKTKADYIIDEQDFKASTREAMFLSMMELIGKLPPEVGIQLLDMVLDFADVPNKEEMVARVRKINGQRDPSRKPTPEEIQAQQKQQAKQDEIEAIELGTAKANLEKLLADAGRLQAQVKQIEAAALQGNTAAFYQATQAAGVIGQQPAIAPTADVILKGAGFKDQGGTDPNLPAPAAPAPGMAPAAPAAPAALDPAAPEAPPELLQADGAQAGIETPAIDGGIPPQ